MPLPEQIRKQVEQADQVAAELNTQAAAGTPIEDTNTSVSDDAAPSASAEVVPLKPADTNEPWEARYKALQGIFDSKFPQMQNELKNAYQLLDHQRQLISTLQGQIQQAAQMTNQATASSSSLTEAEIRDYTPEFFSMMQRWLAPHIDPIKAAVAELQRNIAPAVQQLSSQVQTVAHTQALTREEQFFREISEAIPEWERINTDPKFIEWLNVVDELTGITRQAYLNDARANLDARRVIALFSAYMRESGVASTARAKAKGSASDLNRQATLESTKRSAPSSGAAGKTYTAADLKTLYDAYRRGAYKNREAEFAAEEQKLLLAINEGRYHR